MITYAAFNMFADGVALLVLLMLHISMALDKYQTKLSRSFKMSIYVASFYCVCDIVCQLVNGNEGLTVINYCFSYAAFIFPYIMVVLVSEYLFGIINLKEKTRKKVLLAYMLLFFVWSIALAALVAGGFVFSITDGTYVRRDFWSFSITYPLACMLFDCIIILINNIPTRTKLTFAAFSILPALAVLISYFAIDISSISILLMISGLILYLNIYSERSTELQVKESELKAAQTESMVAQIQPHFLYNCITTCVALCRFDPDRAADMMQNFGKYLRCNLNAFKQKEPIPFDEELEHIKIYLKLEKERFDKKLKIRYNIGATEFVVPALSIQPIVENAVKHGISKDEKNGTVTISTWEEDDFYLIEIADDGRGFDVNAPLNDGRTHIGLENSKKRLKYIVGADMDIKSQVGKGTVITISIPKKQPDEVIL